MNLAYTLVDGELDPYILTAMKLTLVRKSGHFLDGQSFDSSVSERRPGPALNMRYIRGRLVWL